MMKKIFLLFFLLANTYCAISQVDTSGSSFYTVYKRIFSVSCSRPACHDGTFEPDFRTPQSAYFTTVYHPIIKNDTLGSFSYRIVPYNTSQSLLYKRITTCCFININDRMPLTLGRDTLSQEKIALIAAWIQSGAKDLCGNSPKLVTPLPSIDKSYKVYGNDTTLLYEEHFGSGVNRLENKPYRSLIISTKLKTVTLEMNITGGDKDGNLTIPATLKVSDKSEDFSHARSFEIKKINGHYFVEFQPGMFDKDKVYFMHVEVNTSPQEKSNIYPSKTSMYIDKLYWSFVVKG